MRYSREGVAGSANKLECIVTIFLFGVGSILRLHFLSELGLKFEQTLAIKSLLCVITLQVFIVTDAIFCFHKLIPLLKKSYRIFILFLLKKSMNFALSFNN